MKAGAEVNSYIKVEAGKVIIGKQQLNPNISDGDSKRIYGGYACSKLGIQYYANVQGLGTAFQRKIINKIVTLMYKVSLKKVSTFFLKTTLMLMNF